MSPRRVGLVWTGLNMDPGTGADQTKKKKTQDQLDNMGLVSWEKKRVLVLVLYWLEVQTDKQ